MKRVALYARVSTGGQATDNQLRELGQVGSRLGWQIVERYVDEGISPSMPLRKSTGRAASRMRTPGGTAITAGFAPPRAPGAALSASTSAPTRITAGPSAISIRPAASTGGAPSSPSSTGTNPGPPSVWAADALNAMTVRRRLRGRTECWHRTCSCDEARADQPLSPVPGPGRSVRLGGIDAHVTSVLEGVGRAGE